jgi:two-component system, chemotaxis family, chemotaxis protein CheY
MRIIIIDDSSFIQLIGRRTLEKSGHEVVAEAYDGEDGVRKALAFQPDLVVMDIALPKKNGFEAAMDILEGLPKTKVLAISAIDEDWVREKAFASGCYDFLAKPFDAIQLLESIEQARVGKGETKYG